MGHTVDSVTLMCRAHKQISAEHKKRLKPVLNENIIIIIIIIINSLFYIGCIQVALQVLQSNLNQLTKFT